MERMLSKILEEMQFEVIRAKGDVRFEQKKLLDLARTLAPQHVTNIETALANRGLLRLDARPAAAILDEVYKTDILVQMPDGIWNLQITFNLEKVGGKHNTLLKTQPLRRELGIVKDALVVVAPPSENWDGLAMLNEDERDRIEDKIYEMLQQVQDAAPDTIPKVFIDFSWLG